MHLVIAVAWGYRVEIYKAFVLSLRQFRVFASDTGLISAALPTAQLDRLVVTEHDAPSGPPPPPGAHALQQMLLAAR